MTLDMVIVLAILAAGLALFALERVPIDVTALGVMLALVLSGVLAPARAFAGFGNEAVLMLLGLLILTAALGRTGAADALGALVSRWAGSKQHSLVLLLSLAACTLSAFINNTATVALLLPVGIALAARGHVPASAVLMPIAFAAILASSVTLFATSTNIVVSGLLPSYGMAPISVFELTPVGLPIALTGLVYMRYIAPRLIPARASEAEDERFGLGPYLTEVVVLPGSAWIGKTLDESRLRRDLDLNVLRVVRADGEVVAPRAETPLAEGDVVHVEGARENILKVERSAGIAIRANVRVPMELEREDVRVVEAVLLPGSPLLSKSLRELRFRQRFGLQVLAVNRHAARRLERLSSLRLQLGDVLLVRGKRADIAARDRIAFRVLGEVESPPGTRRLPLVLAIFGASVAAAATGLVAPAVAVLSGAVVAFATGCISPEDAYRDVDWRVLILIGSMLALGAAMEDTRLADYLAAQMTGVLSGASPRALLSAFFLLTVVLTQPMSNQAAAIVVLPVAIETAQQLGYDPRPFAMMIAVAASTSFITPLEPGCLLVYAPGRYRFFDFVRVGGPLTLAIYGIAIALVPIVWPV